LQPNLLAGMALLILVKPDMKSRGSFVRCRSRFVGKLSHITYDHYFTDLSLSGHKNGVQYVYMTFTPVSVTSQSR
jgi:hypothetical protein